MFLVDPLRHGSLHLVHTIGPDTAERLRWWDAALALAPQEHLGPWHIELYRHLRSATVGASTRIEGNPLSIAEVDAVIRGESVDASAHARQEVANYNQALTLATSFALAPDFAWSHMVFVAINGQILHGLPEDRQGRYRDGPVYIGEAHEGPHASQVPDLMRRLIDWLGFSSDHPLVRAALLHLNVLAIHPWFDGNGRSSRLLSTLELLRAGVRAPELVNVEPYLASNRGEYIAELQAAHGPTYRPDEHSATQWVAYIVRVSTDRLSIDVLLRDALERDYARLLAALERRSEPLAWISTLWIAAAVPIRTRDLARAYQRSMPWARARLAQMVQEGWLRQIGRTRAAAYVASDRLTGLSLRMPELLRRYDLGLSLEPSPSEGLVFSSAGILRGGRAPIPAARR
jgi:Fic family protein